MAAIKQTLTDERLTVSDYEEGMANLIWTDSFELLFFKWEWCQ